MQNNSPKPIITATKAIILHTFGVQVGVRDEGLRCVGSLTPRF